VLRLAKSFFPPYPSRSAISVTTIAARRVCRVSGDGSLVTTFCEGWGFAPPLGGVAGCEVGFLSDLAIYFVQFDGFCMTGGLLPMFLPKSVLALSEVSWRCEAV